MKKYFKEFILGWLIILAATTIYAEDNLVQFCLNAFEEDGSCPETVCMPGCAGGYDYESCAPSCRPKPCVDIDADHCPQDTCQLLKGCDNRTICYYRVEFGQRACGELGYRGQDVACCESMINRCGVEFFDGTCDMTGKNSLYAVPPCIPCGNGICDQFEDSCNCPEDCKKKD